MRGRIVYKNGSCNITHKHILKAIWHYLADIFTTLIELQWRWAVLIYVMSFVLSWLLFGIVWWGIAYVHNDLNWTHNSTNHTPCVAEVTGFTAAFLFSLETQHALGYGYRVITDECIDAILVLIIQSIFGVLQQAIVTGMIWAKVSNPKRRAETLMFSKEAVICLRDGLLCLMFRVGDMQSSRLVEAHLTAMIICPRVTKEGEMLPVDHQDVYLGFEEGTDRLDILWPTTVIHKIDRKSPFWNMSRSDLSNATFELIVTLEGSVESTGMNTQAKTSYLPSEILWGHRLERLITLQKEHGQYQIDYSRFHDTIPVKTPTCSARDLAAAGSQQNIISGNLPIISAHSDKDQSSAYEGVLSEIKQLTFPSHNDDSSGVKYRKTNGKKYVQVDHTERDISNENGKNNTSTSFADFIQVSDQKAKENSVSYLDRYKKASNSWRLVNKDGFCNIRHRNARAVIRHLMADIFTTMIDLKWRWAGLIYIFSFFSTWILFGAAWFVIGYAHNDFKTHSADHQPCLYGMAGFADSVLYSIETQHGIGFGTRLVTDKCVDAILLLIIQSVFGVLQQALVTGMIYAKVSKPKRRAETLMFSKDAVISCRDGQLCLMFRIGDMQSSHLVEAHIRGTLIRRRVTTEGEVLPFDRQDVYLGYQEGTDRLLTMWPLIVVHKIDEKSPFWMMSKAELERENLEIIVVLEGNVEATGNTLQARTSYIPSEILWGHRFEHLITYQKQGGEYQVDYTRFHNTVPVDTPSCSAKDLAATEGDSSSSSGMCFTLTRAYSNEDVLDAGDDDDDSSDFY